MHIKQIHFCPGHLKHLRCLCSPSPDISRYQSTQDDWSSVVFNGKLNVKLLAITENDNLLHNFVYLLWNKITEKHKFSIKTDRLIEEFQRLISLFEDSPKHCYISTEADPNCHYYSWASFFIQAKWSVYICAYVTLGHAASILKAQKNMFHLSLKVIIKSLRLPSGV